MSFGGLNPFGSSSSSSASSSPPTPNTTESAATKAQITTAIQTSSAIYNAKYLMSKINENCFAACITAPGSSLSSREQTCLSSCMEKYIEAWNVTSRTYIARLQREGAQVGAGSGGGGGGNPLGGAGPGGKELF